MIGPFDVDDAATPITPEERNGLIPTHVTLRHELNELEQQNILEADQWAFGRKRNIVDEAFCAACIAGCSIMCGVGPVLTEPPSATLASRATESKRRCDNSSMTFAIGLTTTLTHRTQLAVRVHHRLVSIHPFPNGNGRWSRMAGDLLVVKLGGSRFTWGSANLQAVSDMRKAYIAALQAADAHDIAPLMAFARS